MLATFPTPSDITSFALMFLLPVLNAHQLRPVYPRLSKKQLWSVVGKAHDLNTVLSYYSR